MKLLPPAELFGIDDDQQVSRQARKYAAARRLFGMTAANRLLSWTCWDKLAIASDFA